MVREKIIQMNSEKEVLIFMEERDIRSEVFVPDLLIDKMCYESFFRDFFFPNGMEEEQPYSSFKMQEKRFNMKNTHLEHSFIEITKNYYIHQETLSEERIRKLMDFCYDKGFIPEFIPIEELISILEDKNLSLHFEPELLNVLKKILQEQKREVKSKKKYIKKRRKKYVR